MNANVNFEAALGVLLFLGTCLVSLVLASFTAYGLIARKYNRAQKGFSTRRTDRTLDLGSTLKSIIQIKKRSRAHEERVRQQLRAHETLDVN